MFKLIVYLLAIMVVILSFIYAPELCEWQVAGYNTPWKFTWTNGCMIGLNDGSFVPLKDYRGVGGNG